MADVLKDLEPRRDPLELLAHFTADPAANFAAAGTLLRFVRQVVLDRDSRQLLGERTAAVPVSMFLLPLGRDSLLAWLGARLLGHRLSIDRRFRHQLAEEEQLAGVEPLRLRPIVSAQKGRDFSPLLRFQPGAERGQFGFKLSGRFLANAGDEHVAVR